jgi:hypothetical protein
MGLLKLRWAVAWIITVFQVASILAYPNGTRFVIEESDSNKLDRRARTVPGSITIDLFKEPSHPTWTGYEYRPGLVGGTVSDQAVRDTAYLTYESVKSKLPSPGLVSVIWVPGGGWAAGTAWKGSNDGFDRFAMRADVFWHSLSVPDQGIRPGSGGATQWHAEAVAVAKSELEFGDALVEGQWPGGTKIYTYGTIRENGQYDVGSKAVCTDENSQVVISCKNWLDRFKIGIVEKP